MSFSTKSSEASPSQSSERPALPNGHLEYTPFGSQARSPFSIEDLADDLAQDLRVEGTDDSFTSAPSTDALQRAASGQPLTPGRPPHVTNGRRVDFSLAPPDDAGGRNVFLNSGGTGRANSQPVSSAALGRSRSTGLGNGQRGSHRQREFAMARDSPMSKSFTAGSNTYSDRSRASGRRGPSSRPVRSSSGTLGSPLQPGGSAESRRGGQGFRRLWQAVTQVGKGEKLGGPDDNAPFAEMTVEDLLKVIRALPPDASAPKAIAQGLYYLDSGALAALLKELAKTGQLRRSIEIFDWLRSLEDGHELAPLADVYTYTTSISQCGSHQQLRRALELVAEMRSRGIPCNVHTYSALMNVCIKANELELALDVYKQMLAEGCVPNLVTYNTLIDVYGKTGQWEEAVKVLDALEQQGIDPEIRTYNTVIIACNMSSQAQEALRVYKRMLAVGAQPTATTYTALISAYGKIGQLERALQIFQDMVACGCERNVITYSSLISACEKAGKWELALELFNEMHREGCKPNVVTYNSLIAACAQGAQHERASQLFEQMQGKGCKPDSVTYSGLIAALAKGGQWRQALASFEQMKQNGCRPDSVVFNNVVGALWETGIVWAQAKAVQVFQAAARQGHFRLTIHSNPESGTLECGMHAFTVGAAVVCFMRWVTEVRKRLMGGPAQGGGDCLGPGGPLRQRLALIVNRGKPSREAAYPAIKAAISAILLASKAPLALVEATGGCRAEASSLQVLTWLHSREAELMTAMYCKTDMLRGLSSEVLLHEDSLVESRCREAFQAVQRFETSHHLDDQALPAEYSAHRKQWVNIIMQGCVAFHFKEEVMHDGVLLLDRTMASKHAPSVNMLPLTAAACLLISAQQGEHPDHLPTPGQVEQVLGMPATAISSMESNVRQMLGNDTSAISTLRCLKLFLERLGSSCYDSMPVTLVAGNSLAVLTEALQSAAFLDIRPSLAAAALLTCCRRMIGSIPAWPSALEHLTSYAETNDQGFAAAQHAVNGMLASLYGLS